MAQVPRPPPHVLIFPLPAQGHVNSMLKLAELLVLSDSDLHVTFLNSESIYRRLLLHTDVQQRFSRYPNFRLETISDGLSPDHPRTGDRIMELIDSINSTTKLLLKEFFISKRRSFGTGPPVTCVIADGILSSVHNVAKECGLMSIAFRTISACSSWVYFCIPELVEAEEIPFKDDDMDKPASKVPGMEAFLRRRDLPSFCRVKSLSDPYFQILWKEIQNTTKADALILNTFEDLEEPILAKIRIHCPNLYTIGPLHAFLKAKLVHDTTSSSQSTNSLFEVDRTCMTWLDSQPLKSVIYVSFGSIAVMKRDQWIEFWYGLVNSGKRFLWVLRQDSVTGGGGESDMPAELMAGTKERGYIVGWAPQEDVLAHKAIGGFLTHSGWNSTLESIFAGVPMICWPYFADQQVNSRFVGEVWKVGLDMKDICDRVVVEKMVNNLMEVRREAFATMANRMAELARQCLNQGGSSDYHFNRLIKDIRSRNLPTAKENYLN